MNKPGKKEIGLAILSGLLLTCSFPKIGLSWFAWFFLVPLLVAIKDLSWKDRFFLGFLSGFAHYLTLFYFLIPFLKTFGLLPIHLCVTFLILLAGGLALYTAVFSMMFIRICRISFSGMILLPVCWVSLEYIRSILITGFPWELLGYSQYNHLHIIQISDILGVYGVSFLIILVNVSLFYIFLYRTGNKERGVIIKKQTAVIAITVSIFFFGLNWIYGSWRINRIDQLSKASETVRVAVIQGNIEQKLKWKKNFQVSTINKYIYLSKISARQKPDLIIWPETAAPFYMYNNKRLTDILQKGIRDMDADFIIGSPSVTGNKKSHDYYNSAYLVKPDGTARDKYDKVHLVPFGEYVPLKKYLPFVGKMVAHAGDFSSGKPGKTIIWRKTGLGIQICYEIIFPDLSRMMVNNGASLLINITNDAWYEKTSVPYQHFSMSIFRAIENRRSLARAANTGISGIIDPVGRVMVATPIFEDAAETRSVPLLNEISLYTRFGDLFAVLCLVLFASIAIYVKVKSRLTVS